MPQPKTELLPQTLKEFIEWVKSRETLSPARMNELGLADFPMSARVDAAKEIIRVANLWGLRIDVDPDTLPKMLTAPEIHLIVERVVTAAETRNGPAENADPKNDLGQDARILYAAKMKSQDRFLTVRDAAKQAGVSSYSKLQRSPEWKAAVKMNAGRIHAGSKDKDGNLEAIADDPEN